MKTLIVYYSLEGNTAYAAKRIAERIGADTLQLVPVKAYRDKGMAKFVWGGRSAMMAEAPKLQDYDIDLSQYDHIVIGFPVWASSFAPPIRTFVEAHRKELRRKDVSAFACQTSRGAEKALEKLRKAIGVEDFAEEATFLDPKKKRSGKTDALIDEFCDALMDWADEDEELDAEEIQPLLEEIQSAVRGVFDEDRVRDFFSHWNYKKHARFCTAVYLGLYAFDMTVSYFICKKLMDKIDAMEEKSC